MAKVNHKKQNHDQTSRFDLTGEKIGRLLVIRKAKPNRHGQSRWFCRCECGKSKTVLQARLKKKSTKSCGCLRIEDAKDRMTTHGYARSPTYSSWGSMIQRCKNESLEGYKDYGARGITVCERWQGENGFANFLSDMGPRPSKSHTIDRKDNDGPYSPDNCRWATRHQQSRNRRDNRFIEFNGERMCLNDWAKKTGLWRLTISLRLKRGWSIERALTTPSRPMKRRNR